MPGRVGIIAGCRTPFAKALGVYRDLTALDLAKACVRELIERSEADAAAIGVVAMGQVIPSVKAPNLGREVVLGAGLPALFVTPGDYRAVTWVAILAVCLSTGFFAAASAVHRYTEAQCSVPEAIG